MTCKHWYEDDCGMGLKEICKLTGKEVICCGDVEGCECEEYRKKEELWIKNVQSAEQR